MGNTEAFRSKGGLLWSFLAQSVQDCHGAEWAGQRVAPWKTHMDPENHWFVEEKSLTTRVLFNPNRSFSGVYQLPRSLRLEGATVPSSPGTAGIGFASCVSLERNVRSMFLAHEK